MKIVFDWVKEHSEKDGDIYYRRASSGMVVAKLQLQRDDVFGNSYCVRIFDYDDENYKARGYQSSVPTNYQFAPTIYQFAPTIAKAQRWADKNLKHLGYKLVSSKLKVML